MLKVFHRNEFNSGVLILVPFLAKHSNRFAVSEKFFPGLLHVARKQ